MFLELVFVSNHDHVTSRVFKSITNSSKVNLLWDTDFCIPKLNYATKGEYICISAPLETDAQQEKKRRITYVSALETEESEKFKKGIDNFFNNPVNAQLLGDLDSRMEYLLGLSDSDYAATYSNDDQYEASSEISIAQQKECMEPPQQGDTTEDIASFEQFEKALGYVTNPANSQLLSDLMVDEPPQHGDKTTEDVASFEQFGKDVEYFTF